MPQSDDPVAAIKDLEHVIHPPAKPDHGHPPADRVIILLTYNTFHIREHETVQAVTSVNYQAGPFYYHILNLGPGDIFIRGDRNPTGLGDEHAEVIPAHAADNSIFIDEGIRGLRIRAGQFGADVTLRLAKSIGTW
jgi:hypothetical protein